uniref:Uncharacterized protein n=1 Tax=Physcomitrium patens TaxID=3218 RepID=A0A2K1KDZ7_PHYPA|nr:hypothetical protein PHYPA_008377 [Physcomitrium patens]
MRISWEDSPWPVIPVSADQVSKGKTSMIAILLNPVSRYPSFRKFSEKPRAQLNFATFTSLLYLLILVETLNLNITNFIGRVAFLTIMQIDCNELRNHGY